MALVKGLDKLELLEAGKMGEHKDLSDIDKGQIVIER